MPWLGFEGGGGLVGTAGGAWAEMKRGNSFGVLMSYLVTALVISPTLLINK